MSESYIDDPAIRKRMRDNYPQALSRALTIEFPSVQFTTYWDQVSIAARPVTERADHYPLNVHHKTFISGFNAAWQARDYPA